MLQSAPPRPSLPIDAVTLVASIALLLVSVAFHEAAHAGVANAFGDSTAKLEGRLTLNPLRHLDPFMSVVLPVALYYFSQGQFVFGAAKPVPVNVARLRPRSAGILVAAAGPLTNVLLGIVFGLLWAFVLRAGIFDETQLDAKGLRFFVRMNFFLAAFNLVPLPPLDGSRVLAGLFPRTLGRGFRWIEHSALSLLLLVALWKVGLFKWVDENVAVPAITGWLNVLDDWILRRG
jgi:Zn-dependent protease